MSIFLSQGFLKAQYFNAKYLSGGNEGQSGWRRLIISQLQEAANRKEEKVKEEIGIKPLTSVIIPPTEKVQRHIKKQWAVEQPEEEVAKEVLKTLKKPIYRGAEEQPYVSEELQIVLQHSQLELSGLWQRLGVTTGLIKNPIAVPVVQDEESDDEALLFLFML